MSLMKKHSRALISPPLARLKGILVHCSDCNQVVQVPAQFCEFYGWTQQPNNPSSDMSGVYFSCPQCHVDHNITLSGVDDND